MARSARIARLGSAGDTEAVPDPPGGPAVTMVRSPAGERLSALYSTNRFRRPVWHSVLRLEAGYMRSLTLRDILRTHHGVTVGNYSYGSLMLPGNADPLTTIGNYVSIGPDVRRFGAAHPISQPSMHPYWYNPRLGMVDPTADVTRTSITIGHDVWIGASSLILPGCTRIGNGAIIGAGTVVTRNVGAYEIWVGNPGRKVNERLTESVRRALDESRWWTLDPNEAGPVLADAGGTMTGLLPRA